MNTRIALRLWLALLLGSAEAVVWAIAVHTGAPHAATTLAAQAPLPAVELPTLTVRPDPADLLAADTERDSEDGAAAAPRHDLVSTAGSGLPRLTKVQLVMPYYSFGKLLPRVRKD